MSTQPLPLVTGVDHYENFPVASVLVPSRLRPAVVALYNFARHADDVADEGDALPAQRLAELDRLRDAFLAHGTVEHPLVTRLLPYLQRHNLPQGECLALLSAFRQDVTVHRYETHAQVLDYCARSANPVGRLMLGIFGCRTPATEALSDAICTALQLINFLQDLAIDWSRGRLYLPLAELREKGLGEDEIARAVTHGRAPPALCEAIAAQVRRTSALLESGADLIPRVPSRLGWEVRATMAGGRRILERLSSGGHDPIAHRPRIGWRDTPALLRLMFTPARIA